ncbi:MAG: hypothetical protein V1793_04180 [Pseudomonadota bacterium]
MYWISVTVLGILHHWFHQGRRSQVSEEFAVAAASTGADDVNGDGGEASTRAGDTVAVETRASTGSLETESDPWERHVIYTRSIEAAYRNRKADQSDHDRAIDLSEGYIKEFPDLRQAVLNRLKDKAKVVSAFKLLAIILEEDGDYDRAEAVCRTAIANGIEDGTKSGFEGRIERINKKQGQPS